MPRPRTILKLALALVAAALLLPFLINVNRFRVQIVRALEAGLGRPVQAAGVRLKLFSGPGFDLQNVTVGEDPAYGIEPFARMGTLRATVRLRSLWTGRLTFSSLVFVEPSVNLARDAGGRWNVEPLLARAAAVPFRAAPPYIELQDARINFKTADTKSVFFLSGVDAAVYSTSAAGASARRLHLRFSGSPARTDRRLTDVGRLRGQASFGGTAAGQPALRVQLDLEDAYLADLGVLASGAGAGSGIHGVLDLSTVFEGEPAALRLSGSARLRDLHRWDMRPPDRGSGLQLRFEALLNVPERSLDVRQIQADLEEGTLEARGSVTGVFREPRWNLAVRFGGARAARLLAAAHHLSSRLPESVGVEGLLAGELALAGPPLRVTGYVAGTDLELRTASGLPPLRAAAARVNFSGNALELQPATLEFDRGRSLSLKAAWDWERGAGECTAAARDLPTRFLHPVLQVAGAGATPLAAVAGADGRITLSIHGEFARGAPPRWGGSGQLARLRWQPAGVSTPVTIHTLRLDFQGEQVRASRIVATWAGGTVTGSVRLSPGPSRLYLADLSVNDWDAAALGAALARSATSASQAHPPPPGAGAPESGAPPFRAEGMLSIGRFRMRGVALENIRAAFRVVGRRLELEKATAALAGGAVTGAARLDFSGAEPRYNVQARTHDVRLDLLAAASPRLDGTASGTVSGSVQAASSGWRQSDLLDRLTMRLRLNGADLSLRDVDLQAAAGAPAGARPAGAAASPATYKFTADLAVEDRRVTLRQVVLSGATAAFHATGSVTFDRQADIRVSPAVEKAALHAFRLVGPLELPRTRALSP